MKSIWDTDCKHVRDCHHDSCNGADSLCYVKAEATIAVSSIKKWAEMPDSQLRLWCGEMTAQEIRTVRAVLSAIMRMNASVRGGAAAPYPARSVGQEVDRG